VSPLASVFLFSEIFGGDVWLLLEKQKRLLEEVVGILEEMVMLLEFG